MNSIVFFFPSHKIGGVEVMYSRIIILLIMRGRRVEICDYADGTIYNIVKVHTTDFIFTEYKNNSADLIQSDYCITSLLYLPYAKNIFPEHTKLLFWDDHPYNVLLFLRYVKLIKYVGHHWFKFFSSLFQYRKFQKCKHNLNKALQYEGICFMCDANYKINKFYFEFHEKSNFLPIPIGEKERIHKEMPLGTINCSYLGRLDSDKYFLCLELMNDIVKYNAQTQYDRKLRLHIIGDGDYSYMIKEMVDKHPDTFIFCGIVKGIELDKYFEKNIDISFAVGTSALESASLSIPTLFMRELSKSPKYSHKYIWVCNNNNFNLSLNPNEFDVNNKRILNMENVIKEYLYNFSDISERCYVYAKNNHSLLNVTDKLLSYLLQTHLTIENLI